jgi:hypothetical protein
MLDTLSTRIVVARIACDVAWALAFIYARRQHGKRTRVGC